MTEKDWCSYHGYPLPCPKCFDVWDVVNYLEEPCEGHSLGSYPTKRECPICWSKFIESLKDGKC